MSSPRSDLRLDWCEARAARYACEHWHYSGSLPTNRSVYIGAWEGGAFIGAVVFGHGANQHMLKPYGLVQEQGCELTRVALREHTAPVSRIVAFAIKILRRHSPGLRLLVSFADPYHEHVGTIYQAMGWIYTGTSPASVMFKTPGGDVVHKRVLSASGYAIQFNGMSRCYRFDECERINTPGKHRYLYPLDNEMRAQIEPLRKPYPKRAGSIASDAPVDPGRGGRCNSDPGAS